MNKMWPNFGKSPLWVHFAHQILRAKNFGFFFIYGSNTVKMLWITRKSVEIFKMCFCDVSKILVNLKILITSGSPIRVIFQNSVTNYEINLHSMILYCSYLVYCFQIHELIIVFSLLHNSKIFELKRTLARILA